jgi:hypothetical protein
VSPVKYELGFYIPQDDILQGHRRENVISYIHHSLHKNNNSSADLYRTYMAVTVRGKPNERALTLDRVVHTFH